MCVLVCCMVQQLKTICHQQHNVDNLTAYWRLTMITVLADWLACLSYDSYRRCIMQMCAIYPLSPTVPLISVASWGQSASWGQWVGQWVGELVGQSVSRSIGRAGGRSVGQSVTGSITGHSIGGKAISGNEQQQRRRLVINLDYILVYSQL